MMIPRLIFGAVFLAFAGAGVHAEPLRIGVSAEPYPPNTWIDEETREWTGWEVDIAREVCAIAELDCVFVPTQWDGIIDSLLNEEIDMIFTSLSITARRKQILDFTDPYWVSPVERFPMVVAQKSLPGSPMIGSLEGLVVGVQQSTIYLDYLEKHLAGTIKEARVFVTYEDVLDALLSGEIDAALESEGPLTAFLERPEGQCCEVLAKLPSDPEVLGMGFGVGLRQEDDDLRERLNGAIAMLIVTGRRDEIYQQYTADNR